MTGTARGAEGVAAAAAAQAAAHVTPSCHAPVASMALFTTRWNASDMLGSVAERSAGLTAEKIHSETSAGVSVPELSMYPRTCASDAPCTKTPAKSVSPSSQRHWKRSEIAECAPSTGGAPPNLGEKTSGRRLVKRARVPAGHSMCAAAAADPAACAPSDSPTSMVSTSSSPCRLFPFPFPFPLALPFATVDSRWLLATAAANRCIFFWRVMWCTRTDWRMLELSAEAFFLHPPPAPLQPPRPRTRERLPALTPAAAAAASSSDEWGMSSSPFP